MARWLEIFGPVALSGHSVRYQMHAASIGKWFEGTAYCPEIGQFAATFSDITDRKRAEQALQESERFIRATLDGLSAHIAIVNERGEIEAVNSAWRQFAAGNGIAPDRVGVGTNYLAVCDVVQGPDAPTASAFAGALRDVLAGRRDRFED